ncbi:MAG TPA: hypothetical protein ENN66_07225 [Proteobacteria bacterium]|nr:hypothetical protein [Pseudomonadota bacterium]
MAVPAAQANVLDKAWRQVIDPTPATLPGLERSLEDFILTKKSLAIKNATLYSLALIEMAKQKSSEPEAATLLTKAAVQVSPDYAFPETALCELFFDQGHGLKSLRHLFAATRKFQSNPQEGFYAATFLWLALAVLPFSLMILMTTIMAVRYFRTFSEMGRIKLKPATQKLLLTTAAIAAVLIIYLQTPLPGLFLLAGLISILATRRDIILLALLLAALLFTPFAYEKGMFSLLTLDSSFFRSARLSESGRHLQFEPASKHQQPAENLSQLVLQFFMQAEIARQRGEYHKAEIFLRQIIAEKIELGAVYNNLANLLFLQKNPETTLDQYEQLYLKAAELEPRQGIPYYNLSRAYLSLSFDLIKSQTYLEKAFGIDPDLSQTHEAQSQPDFMPLPENFYRQYADSQPGHKTFFPEIFRYMLFPGAGWTTYFILVIIFLGGILWQALLTPGNRRLCPGCGRLFHSLKKLKHTAACPLCQAAGRQSPCNLGWHSQTSILLTLTSIAVPGFYQLLRGQPVAAAALQIPALFWLYNFLICRTGIMALQPPSTPWLSLVFPALIWIANLGLIATALSIHLRKQAGEKYQ